MDSRYARQIVLPEIGEEGQRKLASARVMVVGAGGLGSAALYCLASAGVGHIGIVDSDTVELNNLNRQFLHFESDIGGGKAQSAAEKLRRYNGGIDISAIPARFCEENARKLLSDCDLALACVDNRDTRRLLNRFCVEGSIPLVDAGVRGFEGYLLTVIPGLTPCYDCVFPHPAPEAASSGVLGATAAALGSMAACEAIKLLLGIRPDCPLHYVDLFSMRIAPIAAKREPGCPVCGPHGECDLRE